MTLKIVNPANGKLICKLPEDTATEVRRKYLAARAAQPTWARTPMKKRLAAIARFRELLVTEREALARVLTEEVGKPITQSRNELSGVLGRIDFFLEHTRKTLRDTVVLKDTSQKLREFISHEPLGVVANISAWNYPYFVGTNVFVPALLAGNSVLYKASEFATLTGREITRLLHASGVPRNAFVNVVGAGKTGAALLRQPVDGVFFTGSHATGVRIARGMAARMIPVQLELGGKDPVYVCEDADVATAAASVADGAFYNTGQSCCSVERIYVHERVYDAFVKAFVAEVSGYRIGDPADERTYIGPLARAAQLGVLRRQVADAKKKGARLLLGGKAIPGTGHYFAPTIFADAGQDTELMQEESFGPIIGISKVANDDQAARFMNDTRYGLTAGVYSRDERRAMRVLSAVRSGSAYWNCCDRVSPRLPWSGVGESGMGVTLSIRGIEAFTRTRAWHLKSA
ncbi:MAG: aldehyde dehydrogenase family protein [Betaproteobacteria bacterium]|nr:aldehyde dehydrogenase family protein [Betaproteobacteria bacterium]